MLSAIRRAPASSPLAGAGAAAAKSSSRRRSALAGFAPQPREAFVQALVAAAQRLEQAGELVLEPAELAEHVVRGLLHARSLLAGARAQLGGAGLGGLEDRADLLGRAGRERRRRGGRTVAQRLHAVGDEAQVRVDRRLVVAAAADREVAALDRVSIHARQDSHAAGTTRTIAWAAKCVRRRSRSSVDASWIRPAIGSGSASQTNSKPTTAGSRARL